MCSDVFCCFVKCSGNLTSEIDSFVLDVHYHLLMHVRVTDDLAKLLKVDFAVFVLVGKEDCLVDDLLQLSVFQIGTHHHFQHLEELTVADVPVVINIVDSVKSKEKFVK